MNLSKIKEFLKKKIENKHEYELLCEFYKLSDTEADFKFLLQILLKNQESNISYKFLKLFCLVSLKLNEKELAYNSLLSLHKKVPANVETISLIAYLEQSLDFPPTSNFFDLKRDIHFFDTGLGSLYNSSDLIKVIKKVAKENYEPSDQSVKKGSVYFLKRGLDSNLDDFLGKVLPFFDEAIQKIKLSSPFIMKQEELKKISFWAVSIKEGGNMEPHFHPQGKMSGVIYINVDDKSSGDFVTGAAPSGMIDSTNELTIAIKNFRIIVFPSYYLHKTLFNSSATERFSMSFDLI